MTLEWRRPALLENDLPGSVVKKLDTTLAAKPTLLAWAGWQMHVPADWRPLKVMGTPDKGWMMIGDSVCAYMSIHWQRSKRVLSDGESWASDRLRRLGLLPDPSPPAAERFSSCTWANGVQNEEEKQTTHWFGYAAASNLYLGIKVNGILPDHDRKTINRHVLPSLRTSEVDAATAWAMYDLGFVAPAGFTLARRHLYMGDVALEFHKGRGERLMLRQVYPGDLALARRDLERWLQAYPFKEHRKLRKSGLTTTPWRHASRTELLGVRRRGAKKLGFPLGVFGARWNHAIIAHDHTLNRLLIAEHSAAAELDESVCDDAVARMNEALREGR